DMADASISREVMQMVFPVNIGYPTHIFRKPQLPLREGGHPCRIVTPIFQALESLENYGCCRAIASAAHYAAHLKDPSLSTLSTLSRSCCPQV
ncbi:MAG: hypothetical protein QGH72_05655, partial [Dehalococcoidia bacterium]|nr:hypothetical protein [Dehalococcoidia bacterium]